MRNGRRWFSASTFDRSVGSPTRSEIKAFASNPAALGGWCSRVGVEDGAATPQDLATIRWRSTPAVSRFRIAVLLFACLLREKPRTQPSLAFACFFCSRYREQQLFHPQVADGVARACLCLLPVLSLFFARFVPPVSGSEVTCELEFAIPEDDRFFDDKVQLLAMRLTGSGDCAFAIGCSGICPQDASCSAVVCSPTNSQFRVRLRSLCTLEVFSALLFLGSGFIRCLYLKLGLSPIAHRRIRDSRRKTFCSWTGWVPPRRLTSLPWACQTPRWARNEEEGEAWPGACRPSLLRALNQAL